MLQIEGMSGSEVYDLDVTLQVQLDLLSGSVKDVLLELEQAPRLSCSFVPNCSLLFGVFNSFQKAFAKFLTELPGTTRPGQPDPFGPLGHFAKSRSTRCENSRSRGSSRTRRLAGGWPSGLRSLQYGSVGHFQDRRRELWI